MFYNLFYIFLLFFIYSVIGYIFEVIVVTINQKKFTPSRGFLIGPYLPIYGVGVITIVKLLSNYQNDLLVLFVMSTILCSILEYITSFLMEKIFKLRWWDYSHMKFNINGRVCLKNSIMFGIGGLIIVKILNPIIEGSIIKIQKWIIILLGIIFMIIIITDLIISIIAIFNIKIEIKKYTRKDATEAIKNEISEFLKNHYFLHKLISRIFAAFPNAKHYKNIDLIAYKELVKKLKQEIKEAKKEYRKKRKALKQNLTKRKLKDKM